MHIWEMSVADYLRRKRAEASLTVNAAKGKIGIAQSYLSELEGGIKSPSNDVVEKIVSAYNLSETEKLELQIAVTLEKAPKSVKEYFLRLLKQSK